MPKSTKKRKEKAADFSKAKLKLGKGKQLAPNVIDTSFKARSIAVPSQSITHDKDVNTPTTKRNLTFDDLITDTKHYAASTRRDAIAGLRELLDANGHLMESSLTTVIDASARLIGDEDTNVRKALLAFLTWLFPHIPTADLVPHSRVLMLFVTFALSHIFPDIRIDAVRFLDLFLEHLPHAVTTGWNENKADHGRRILEGYLGLLNANTKFLEENDSLSTTANTNVTLTPASKLVVLRSLSAFLQASLPSIMESPSPDFAQISAPSYTWFLASSFRRTEDYGSFEMLFAPSLEAFGARKFEVVDAGETADFICAPLAGLFTGEQYTLQEVTNASNAMGQSEFDKSDVSDIDLTMILARTLHSTLIATFVECAPNVFSPSASPPETEVQLVLALSQIVRDLYAAILQTSAPVKERYRHPSEDLQSFLGHMSPYFPFTPSRTHRSRDIKMEQAFQKLNLIYCELSSLLALTLHTQTTRGARQGKRTKGNHLNVERVEGGPSIHTERVSSYVLQLLSGTPVFESQLGLSLTPTSYLSLLPAIWALFKNTSLSHQEISSAVLHATINHSIKMSHKSSIKRLTIGFVGRLILLSTEHSYHENFRIERHPTANKIIADWISHLPQALWELGGKDLIGSHLILTILLRIYQRRTRVPQASETASILRSKLVPFFNIVHPHRGQLPGPYGKLPVASAHRRLALDLAATLLVEDTGEEGPRLRAAVELVVAGTEEFQYWTRITNTL